ncbi:hypothetical protein [Streptomyces sp. KL116D]|uniref:hypothetical protein n=1 Tax=Streptomyces sp. KL116D TaxID=3045152 RepID=UPI0035565054
MMAFEITPEEQTELDKALYDALNPLALAIRSRQTGLPADRVWEADPIDVTLSVLAAWKVMDAEVRQLTAHAAATAGSYGASYEQMGAVWGITRQGARKKWPGAINRSAPATAERNTLALFGGTAELVQVPSGDWSWTGVGADGTSASVTDETRYATADAAAAHAGAFLKEHSSRASDRS